MFMNSPYNRSIVTFFLTYVPTQSWCNGSALPRILDSSAVQGLPCEVIQVIENFWELTTFNTVYICMCESVYQSHRGPWTVFVDKSARFYSADSEPRSPDSPLPTMSPGPSDTPQDPTVSPDSDSPRSDTGPQSPQPSQPSPRESGTGPTWTVDRGPWTIGHEFRKTTELFGKGVNMSLHAYIHIHTTLTHANHPPIHPSVRSCTQIT